VLYAVSSFKRFPQSSAICSNLPVIQRVRSYWFGHFGWKLPDSDS